MLSTLLAPTHTVEMPCGGRKNCGKCKISAKGSLSPISDTERRFLSEEELSSGIRLACCTTAIGDCVISSATVAKNAINTDGELPDMVLRPAFNKYGIAIDIGTTTLAARLYTVNGALLSTDSELNPQKGFGADVISRIEAALDGKATELATVIRDGLNGIIANLAKKADIDSKEIDGAVITGNTVMLHLLTETSTEPLSHAPFNAERLFGETVTAEELSLSSLAPQTPIYLPRCAEAFVGADITTALLASGISGRTEPSILVDIGTNGEMALVKDGEILLCSTAAGPAFEGAGLSMGMNGKTKILTSMAIFGTVGIFVRFIPMASAGIAFCRGVLGCIFLLALMALTGKKPNLEDMKRNGWILAISGAAIGINWILLFESYRYTTVAIATICYYLAPAFVTLASPLVGEKLTVKKLVCIGVALLGMVFVSGVLQGNQESSFLGIVLGVGAAVFYASVILLNKKLSPIGAYDKTLCQLGAASVVVAPYILLTGGIYFGDMAPVSWIMLAVLGVVHTGFAYALYFGAIRDVNAQTAAILSYLDPVLSILLSALILRERLDIFSLIGAMLILGSALYSELPTGKK